MCPTGWCAHLEQTPTIKVQNGTKLKATTMIKRMKNQNPEKSLNETHKHHWTKINSKKSNAEWNFKKV